MPALDFDSSGNVLVTYYDRQNDCTNNLKYDEYYTKIDSTGSQLVAPTKASSFQSDPSDNTFLGGTINEYRFIGDYQQIWCDGGSPITWHSAWIGAPVSGHSDCEYSQIQWRRPRSIADQAGRLAAVRYRRINSAGRICGGKTRLMKNAILLLAAFALAPLATAQTASISSVTPASGLTTGLTYVHLHGQNLQTLTLGCPPPACVALVTFGDQPGAIVDSSFSELVVIAPPHAAGVVDIHVHLPGADDFSVAQGYRYQDPAADDMIRLLVPVAISANGVFGTSWHTDFLVSNANTDPVTLGGASTPPGGRAVTVPAFATVTVPLYPPAGNTGAFVYLPKRLAENVTESLRVHDTTRDSDSWGADIPVVPETQFKRVVVLPGVPSDSRYRTLLRLYSYSRDTTVRIDVRDDDNGALLLTREAAVVSGLPLSGSDKPSAPAYAQMALDPLTAPLAGAHPRLRVVVTSTDDAADPLWAFISVTNNTTQQVTTVTPGMSHPTMANEQ